MPRVCSKCGREWDDAFPFCPLDATPLAEAEPAGPADPYLGVVLAGAYRLVELLDAEGMGRVYRVEHERLKSPAACKLLRRERTDAEHLARFAEEARTAAHARHPAVVRPFDYGQFEDGTPWLLMEFLEGVDLGRRLRQGPLEPAEAVRVVATVAEAVAGLHEDGIVHCDLKPSSVFLQETGGDEPMVRLLDIGLARRLAVEGGLTASADATPLCLSPEQARGERRVGPPADVVSLGVVLYEALTGVSPFAAADARGVLARILADEPPPPSEVRPGVPRALDALVLRTLAKEPEARHASAGELLRALRELPAVEEEAGGDDAPAPPADDWMAPRCFSTVLLADLVAGEGGQGEGEGATRLVEAAEEAVVELGGTAERLAGGSLLAVFRATEGGGQEPVEVVRAALGFCERAEADSPSLQPRIAIATTRLAAADEALPRTGPLGEAIERVSAVLSGVETAGVYVGEVTKERILGRFEVARPGPGSDGPVRVLRELPHLDPLEVRTLFGRPVPLVGRELEVRQCLDVFERVFHEDEAWLVSIVGTAGIGKSHLRHTVLRAVAEDPRGVWLFSCRGRPGRVDDPFGVLAEMLRRRIGAEPGEPPATTRERLAAFLPEHLGPAAPDAEQVLSGLLSPAGPESVRDGSPASEEDVHRALGRLLEAMGRRRPVWILIEDGQWADAASLAFLEHLHDFYAGRLFATLVARPELWDRLPGLLTGRERHVRLDLQPLSRAEARVLLQAALGSFPAALEELLWQRGQGVPLFIEAILWTLAERGTLRPGFPAWELTAPLSDDLLPPMMEGVLQARLEALPPHVADVALRASVFGRRFWAGGIAALGTPRVEEALSELVRHEIVHRLASSRVAGSDEYAFRHDALRQVAHGMIPTAQRRELSERAGAWVCQALPREPSLAAGLYEQAHAWEAAAGALERALAAGLRQGRAASAGPLAFRALELACRGDDGRLREALARPALERAWDLEDAGCCARVERLLASRPEESLSGVERVLMGLAGALRLAFLRRPGDAREALSRVVAPVGGSLPRAWRVRALVEAAAAAVLTGREEQASAWVAEAEALVEPEGSLRERALVAWGAWLLAAGPTGEALHLAEEALSLALAAGDVALEARLRRGLSVLHVQLGCWETARAEAERALALADRIGARAGEDLLPWLHLRRGRPGEAREALGTTRPSGDGEPGAGGGQGCHLSLLDAWAELDHGTLEALGKARRLLDRHGPDPAVRQDPACRGLFLVLSARLLARERRLEEALEPAEEAVRLYRATGGRPCATLLEPFALVGRLRTELHDEEGARAAVEEGLALAAELAGGHDEGVRRSFVGSAPDVVGLREQAEGLGVAVPGVLRTD